MRADNAGLAPVEDARGAPMTFANWYLAWLVEAEQAAAKPFLPRATERMRRSLFPANPPRSSGRDWLMLLLVIIAGGVVTVLFALR